MIQALLVASSSSGHHARVYVTSNDKVALKACKRRTSTAGTGTVLPVCCRRLLGRPFHTSANDAAKYK
jgi:hypothetical protein